VIVEVVVKFQCWVCFTVVVFVVVAASGQWWRWG